ncbi:hypothetical protein TNCV_1898861 [Trichonephila clavipes]|nr:hypothetical protein TNCV_1898861 [Trichonephila clavipes]
MGSIPKHLEKVEDVPRFRLTTGHAFWGVYPTGLACLLRRSARFVAMPEWIAITCTGLYEYRTDDVGSRYWEARHQMVKAAVAEWYRYRIVACVVTSSSAVPLKSRRVGQRCTLNLSRAERSSCWCGS